MRSNYYNIPLYRHGQIVPGNISQTTLAVLIALCNERDWGGWLHSRENITLIADKKRALVNSETLVVTVYCWWAGNGLLGNCSTIGGFIVGDY